MKLVHTVAAALGVGFICAVPFTIEATPSIGHLVHADRTSHGS